MTGERRKAPCGQLTDSLLSGLAMQVLQTAVGAQARSERKLRRAGPGILGERGRTGTQ